MEKKKALIVDDDPRVGRGTGRMLRTLGFETTLAGNGAEGLDRARAEKFDLIVSDIEMPVMNGIKLAETLQAEGIDATVVLVSGNVQKFSADLVRLASGGAISGFLGKPYGRAEIDELLDSSS